MGGGFAEEVAHRLGEWAEGLRRQGVSTRRLTVIGGSQVMTDIFCLMEDGGVLWLGDGEEVDRFSCFEEFFKAQVAYAEPLSAERTARPRGGA